MTPLMALLRSEQAGLSGKLKRLVCSVVAKVGAGAHTLEKVAAFRPSVAFIIHPQLLPPTPRLLPNCGQESHTFFLS